MQLQPLQLFLKKKNVSCRKSYQNPITAQRRRRALPAVRLEARCVAITVKDTRQRLLNRKSAFDQGGRSDHVPSSSGAFLNFSFIKTNQLQVSAADLKLTWLQEMAETTVGQFLHACARWCRSLQVRHVFRHKDGRRSNDVKGRLACGSAPMKRSGFYSARRSLVSGEHLADDVPRLQLSE